MRTHGGVSGRAEGQQQQKISAQTDRCTHHAGLTTAPHASNTRISFDNTARFLWADSSLLKSMLPF